MKTVLITGNEGFVGGNMEQKLLTIGSGPHYAEGWINLDLNTHDEWERQADIIASVYDMPFEDEYIDRVYMGHLLEHLEYEQIPEALAEVKRVCKPGAEIMVVGPCLDRALATNQPEWLLNDIREHGHDGSGFGHAWTPTEALTLEAVKGIFSSATVINISVVTRPYWPNPSTAIWQCAIKAFA